MYCLVFIIIYNTPKLAEIPYMNPLTWQQNPQICGSFAVMSDILCQLI